MRGNVVCNGKRVYLALLCLGVVALCAPTVVTQPHAVALWRGHQLCECEPWSCTHTHYLLSMPLLQVTPTLPSWLYEWTSGSSRESTSLLVPLAPEEVSVACSSATALGRGADKANWRGVLIDCDGSLRWAVLATHWPFCLAAEQRDLRTQADEELASMKGRVQQRRSAPRRVLWLWQ